MAICQIFEQKMPQPGLIIIGGFVTTRNKMVLRNGRNLVVEGNFIAACEPERICAFRND